MESFFELHDLPYYISLLGYVGIFVFFVTVDQFTPVPEEISLLTIGYLLSKGLFHPVLAGVVALLAFLTVDSAYFLLVKTGKQWGRRLRNKTKSSFLGRIRENLMVNFPKALFVLCFIPHMRLWAPIVSGMMQIPYLRFIGYDALSLGLFTTLYISAGLFFHKGMRHFLAELDSFHNVFFVAFVLIVSVVIYFSIKRYRHEQVD